MHAQRPMVELRFAAEFFGLELDERRLVVAERRLRFEEGFRCRGDAVAVG